MGEYSIILSRNARKTLLKVDKSGDKGAKKKIEDLFKELSKHPRTGTGKPEELSGDLSGYWSRRIDKKNRLIYEIDEEYAEVHISGFLGHYGDK